MPTSLMASILFVSLLFVSCREYIKVESTNYSYHNVQELTRTEQDKLIAVSTEDDLSFGDDIAYLDMNGDTIIPSIRAKMRIIIKDDSFAGKALSQILIETEKYSCTLKEIIEKRVEAEIEKYNKLLPKYFTGLVQPTESEATLNGYLVVNRKK